MTFIYTFIRSFKETIDKTNIFSFSGAIIAGFILLIPSSLIAGSKKSSTIISTLFSFFGSLFGAYITNTFLIKTIYFGGIGELYVYFSICILLGFICGNIGGFLVDRYFLHQR